MCTRSHFCLGLAVGMAAGTCLGIRMKTREKQIRLRHHDALTKKVFQKTSKKSLTKHPRSDIINLASSERRTTGYGGIAQLGERLNGIQEVSGSIPLISTKRPEIVRFQVFCFFGREMPLENKRAATNK